MLNEENEFGRRVSSSAFQSPPSRTSLESSASKSLCILHTRVTISIANRQSSTCFIRSGKPKALGGHASSTRAESASRLLVSKWWAGKSAKCLGSTVSEQVRCIWRDEEHVWGKSEEERCPHVLLKTEKEEISLGVWGDGRDKEVKNPRMLGGSETETSFDVYVSSWQACNHSSAQAQDFLIWCYRHKTKGGNRFQGRALLQKCTCEPTGSRCVQQGAHPAATRLGFWRTGMVFMDLLTWRPTSNFVKTRENKARVNSNWAHWLPILLLHACHCRLCTENAGRIGKIPLLLLLVGWKLGIFWRT